MKIRVGITGQSGFIGTHLFNGLRLRDDTERIDFERKMFDDEERLRCFAANCDAIVHLAGMSRGDDQALIYETNMRLIRQLLTAATRAGNKPHILFASTIHEAKDTRYHASKRDGRALVDKWAREHNATSTGLIMPNVFGPCCKPCFNSFVATFCHKAAIGGKPEIISDAKVELIYVETLCGAIYEAIRGKSQSNQLRIPHEYEVSPAEVQHPLETFRAMLRQQAPITFSNLFSVSLFNTFLSYRAAP